jgi:hypothetical protein
MHRVMPPVDPETPDGAPDRRHTMKFGVLSMNTDEGINPLTLAREAEDLGIE